MLQKITIEGLNFKDYQGVDKRTGESYSAKIVGIFDGREWYSFFDRKGISKAWNKGDTIEFEVTIRTQNGKEYKNVSLPDKATLADSKASELVGRVEKLERFAKQAVKVLDEAFPGWREDVKDKNAPLNVDEIISGIEEMNTAKEASKLTQKKDDTRSDDGALWNS